ncbi:potassium channel family protein [Campylobacter sp. MIT 97-5078]|uniref:potassium channel family protein n=1 Tax=Campylobacter sp. MIT 97-5078 TaxID=1548153 RepID=UPI000513E51C|nr:TrkA family potassium uptake protein [Campylobacter sp. MIT 97-5078]KGI57367.1 potassium transporter [Campylobacter sp. MIT 97-5078]TQR27455.1 TrkA family potassium uptake protein [Campylobacter sp. MIT 97-5078]
MKNGKIYGIIGLGKFGSVIANELINGGQSVIVADRDENSLKELQDKVSYAYILDSTNVVALKEAGFHNIDIVIVSIGENVEKSILTLMALKDIGVETVITKATSLIHGQILSKLGSSKVIYPEKESAIRLAKEFLLHTEFEVIDISANTIRAVKIIINDSLVGRSLQQIAQNMRLIGYKKKGSNDWELLPELLTTLVDAGDSVILLGTAKELEEFEH